MEAKDRFPCAAVQLAALLVAILLGAAPAVAQAPARKMIVADVLIRGNQRLTTQSIQSYIKTRANTEYNPDQVQEDVRQLMATRQFGNVQVRYNLLPNDRVEVTFWIVDYPNVVQEVKFEGAELFKESELETEVRIQKGMPLNPIANQAACQAIVQKYKLKGRPFASCTLAEGGKQGDTRVVFSITEGPQVFVRDIEFTGNEFVSGGVLKTHILSSEKVLGINFLSKPYIPEMADADADKLREYYRNFGFHDVRVSREVQWDLDSKSVVLHFHIQEGTRYRVRSTPRIVGTTSFKEDELGRLIQVKSEEYYDHGQVEKDLARIKDYIGHTGRQVVVQDRVFVTDPGQCVVQYELQERPPARVGRIFISGNTITRQDVILRQLPLFPNQLLSFPGIREGERNLARLNLFENNPETGVRPTITVLDPDSDSPYKDILVNVQETRTGSLLFGVGFNSDAGATGSIVLNERNFDITNFPTSLDDLLSGKAFRGAGQELRIEAVPGTELQRYTISFREPYLFNTDYSLTVGGYYYTRYFLEYNERREGGRVSVGRRLNELWTASATVRVENVNVFDVPFFAPQDYQDVRGGNFQLGLRAGLTRDDRDSYLRPTEGSLLDISYEQVTGERDFPLVNIDYNRYWTVAQRADGSGRHVVAFHSQLGFAGDNTPVYERYYAGGFRSMRGFEFRGVGPYENGFNVGGEFLFLNSLEYQLPVRAGDNLFLVGFVDSGTVERDIELKNYRVSAGVGVRFIVPMLGPVPIALDFGFPIVKGPFDREQIFSFWLGFFR